jgi:hypothetical protein
MNSGHGFPAKAEEELLPRALSSKITSLNVNVNVILNTDDNLGMEKQRLQRSGALGGSDD